jgi:hypothetical protein
LAGAVGVSREAIRRAAAVTPFTPLRTAAKTKHEESLSYVAKNQRLERISLLFTNVRHFPKLDVAGSSPVSRSNKCIHFPVLRVRRFRV